MEIGRASLASSIMASAIDSLTLSSIGTNDGAPIASCRDRAPTILAFSNLVSFCGPIRTSKPSSTLRFVFLLSLEAAIVTKRIPGGNKGPFGTHYKGCVRRDFPTFGVDAAARHKYRASAAGT
jgi:hypothetical protein